jgi:cell division protein FtsB
MIHFRHIILITVTAFIFVYISYIGIKNIFRYNGLVHEQIILSTQLVQAQKKYQQLNTELALSENSDYWDYLAKHRLGFIHLNESVYYITPQ